MLIMEGLHMELRHLRSFVAVARERHFTRAAARLHVAQPALSQQMQQLERELGITLFDRTNRRVHLTDAGAAFLRRAERILAEVERAQADMHAFAGLARGRVTIGALQSVGERFLPPVLAGFHRQYPGLEIVLREESTEQLVALLRAEQLDVALIHLTANTQYPAVTYPLLKDAEMVMEALFTEDLVVIVAPDHPLALHEQIGLHALQDAPVICFKPGSSIRHVVMHACAAEGFMPTVAFESEGTMTVRALAAAGLGIAVVPRSVTRGGGPQVAVLELNPPPLTRTVVLAWYERGHRTPAAEAFLTFARENVERAKH